MGVRRGSFLSMAWFNNLETLQRSSVDKSRFAVSVDPGHHHLLVAIQQKVCQPACKGRGVRCRAAPRVKVCCPVPLPASRANSQWSESLRHQQRQSGLLPEVPPWMQGRELQYSGQAIRAYRADPQSGGSAWQRGQGPVTRRSSGKGATDHLEEWVQS